MNEILMVIALVNGQLSFNQQDLSGQACFEAMFMTQINQRTSQFIFDNANEGRMLAGCYIKKTDETSSGDPTGDHNLLINAISNGNFTTGIVEFGNQSACQLAARKVINTVNLLLNHTGDTGAVDAFCIDTGEELDEIDLFDDGDDGDDADDGEEVVDPMLKDDQEPTPEMELPDPALEGTIIAMEME